MPSRRATPSTALRPVPIPSRPPCLRRPPLSAPTEGATRPPEGGARGNRMMAYSGGIGHRREGRAEIVRAPADSPRIVALGGGTGLPAVLRGLKSRLYPAGERPSSDLERQRLTAIVTVADDGGSSGRLRRDYNVLPPGDLRNCLLALAEGDPS